MSLAQRSSLAVHEDLGGVVLEVDQLPITAWILPFALLVTGALLVLAAILGQPVALGRGAAQLSAAGLATALACSAVVVLLALLPAGSFRRVLRIELTPARVRLTGWIGRPPLPTRRELPLAGARVGYARASPLGGVQTWVIALDRGEERLRLPGMCCTEAEVLRIVEHLRASLPGAEHRHGTGELEVPPGLRDLRRQVVDAR